MEIVARTGLLEHVVQHSRIHRATAHRLVPEVIAEDDKFRLNVLKVPQAGAQDFRRQLHVLVVPLRLPADGFQLLGAEGHATHLLRHHGQVVVRPADQDGQVDEAGAGEHPEVVVAVLNRRAAHHRQPVLIRMHRPILEQLHPRRVQRDLVHRRELRAVIVGACGQEPRPRVVARPGA